MRFVVLKVITTYLLEILSTGVRKLAKPLKVQHFQGFSCFHKMPWILSHSAIDAGFLCKDARIIWKKLQQRRLKRGWN